MFSLLKEGTGGSAAIRIPEWIRNAGSALKFLCVLGETLDWFLTG